MYDYVIYPIEFIFKIIYLFLASEVGHGGLALILLAFVSKMVTYPFEAYFTKIAEKEKQIQQIFRPQVERIKSQLSGSERHDALKRMYRRYSYHPLYSLSSISPLLVQLPFFIAVFFMIQGLTELNGISFLGISDISKPDALLGGINALPFVMFTVNILALHTGQNLTRQAIVQGWGLGLMFLVLLYTSPAALLIYFTTNQFIALLLGLKKRFFGAFKINEDNKKSIIFLAVVSISIIFNLVFFKPLSIIFDNPQDIVGAPQLYLFHFLRLALIAASALFIVLFIIRKLLRGYEQVFFAVCFCLCINLYIQANIMQWDYGRLNGQPIAWNVFWWRELIEFSVWGAVFFFGIKYFEKIINNSIAILVVTLLSVLCFFPFKYNEQLKSVTVYDERSSARFERDPAKRFVLSKKKNIIMLVLDGFGDQLFQEILKEKPGLEKDLDGFVRFPQMLGVGGYTIYSTATYLGGEPYLNKTDINTYRRNLFGKGNSLYRQMADKGWKNGHHHSFSFNTFFRFNPHTPELLDNVTLSSDGNVLDQNSMLAISIFSSSPQSLKRFFYSLFGLETQWDTETVIEEAASPQIVNLPPLPGNHADVKFMNDMMKHVRVSEDGPVFKYYHILGVHHPNTIDRNLKPVESSSAKEVGLADVILVKRFIEILKEAGCYDNSQIYIMADHGLYPITSSMETAKKLMTEVYPKRTSTLFLFKDYGSSGSLRTNNLRLTYEDFSEIITTLADMKPGTDTRQALKSLERNERSFHTFSNMGGKFYPTIIRMKVKGDSRNPANWSIDRLFFAIEEGEPLGDGDSFKFAKLEEYGGYIVNGIIGTGTYTRGTVDFALPLDSALKGKSVKVTLNIAPAITPGVKARFYEVKATRKLIAKGSLTSLKYKNISFSVPPTAQENGVLKFSLIPLNTTPGATKEVSTGKYLRSPSFKLNKISIDVSKK